MGILKTAVKVGVASSVHGRVQRRQQQRWAAQDQAAASPPPRPAAPPPEAARDSGTEMDERLAQLAKLGELKNAGVLSDAEFEQQKARILSG